MNSFLTEINPGRSFQPRNDTVNLRAAYESGASFTEGLNWVSSQILSLLVEHGPVQSTRQAPFSYRIDLSGSTPRVFARFPDDTGSHFGDQHKSFLTVESEYPSVRRGWETVVNLLADPQSAIGAGVFWISPMKFYLTPRLAGDKPSTYDVLNFYRVTRRSQNQVIVSCRTIKLDGPLTPSQHRALIRWHDPTKWLPANLSEEAVVASPVRFAFHQSKSLDDHFDNLNGFTRKHPEFNTAIAGDSESGIAEFILDKIRPYLQTFHRLLIEGAEAAVNNLIWRLVRIIKSEDALDRGLDVRSVWSNFLSNMAFAVHPLTGEALAQFVDPATGGWRGGDQCSPAAKKESEPYCENCRKHHPEGKCRKS